MKAPIPPSRVVAITIAIAIASLSIVPCSSCQWQILTKHNFSSQIGLHQHVLLLVTIPWSGESRSLMKHVSLVVADKPHEFGNLKLMFIHRNTEKMLADSIGATATDEITVIYFHYSVSYKYRGRLRANNILSSLYHYMSLAPEEVPLKALNTPQDFTTFLDSTDEALVLVDFCGWTPKLLAENKMKNGTVNGFSMHGDHLGMGLSGGNYRISVSREKTNQKRMTCARLNSALRKGFVKLLGLGSLPQ